MLKNGSLLIVSLRVTDSGEYRCDANNQFLIKSKRTSFISFTVESRTKSDDKDFETDELLPDLQHSVVKIKSGENLILHCAARKNRKVCFIKN